MTFSRWMSLGLLMLLILGMVIVFAPNVALAQSAPETISEGLKAAAGDSYSTNLTVSIFVGNLIRTLLAATGIAFLIITIYAGILYMIAEGEKDKVEKAKKMLTNSVIGLIIIVGAYAFSTYVINALAQATTVTTQ